VKRYYWLGSLLCLLASVPFVLHLANRRGGGPPVVRFGSFNVALNRPQPGALLQELRGGGSEAARQIAAIVQRLQLDVVLLNEVDHDDAGAVVEVLQREYFAKGQDGLRGIEFGFVFTAPVNTGSASGFDLDGDGRSDGPADAFGYGAFPGQYGMVLLSRHPILREQVRTFRELRWSAMPGALRPDGHYQDAAWAALRLSSKSHWDVPIGIGDPARGGRVVHALCSHPTPPAFDGPADHNGCRNHDEIRFWVDYLTPAQAGWIVDDRGVAGGLAEGEAFVVLGDLNCDPVDGDAQRASLHALLAHPRVQDPAPQSRGGEDASKRQFGQNSKHLGPADRDTGDFDDTVGTGPGNLRVDYVLPSRDLELGRSGVFWPLAFEAGAKSVAASDHRAVWVDVVLSSR
jgi:endonuclease/exonuclease/phosphatase family metal-dependent hydrolase